jgi:addiction module HigA family antidote
MTMMHNPPHPGELLRDEVIAALDLSVTEAGSRLAMSRVALSRVLNGKAAISSDLALRLEQAARGWLAMQANCDLWRARQHVQPPVRSLQGAG